MNKYLIAAVMVVLIGVGYSQRGEAAACPSGAFLGVYTNANGTSNGFTCDIGDKTFSNFIIPFNTQPTSIAVTPVLGPPLWGFNFAVNMSAIGAVVQDLQIGYTVTCNALAPVFNCIKSDDLSFNGFSAGTGSAQIVETKCLNSNTINCTNPIQLVVNALNNGGPLHNSVNFTPVHMETVNKDISVQGGNTNTASTISQISNTVDQVPEPATLALLGAGLFSLAALRRRKAAQ